MMVHEPVALHASLRWWGAPPDLRQPSRAPEIAGPRPELIMPSQSNPGPMQETRRYWPLMTAYERFEHVVALVLSLIIAMVIALALVQLSVRVVPLLVTGAVDPLDHEVFQGLFGMVMTVLIALEFKHSIVRVAVRRESIGQGRTGGVIAR